MTKNTFLSVLTTALLSTAVIAQAQQPAKMFRIGYLSPRAGMESREQSFLQGLRELGYTEGKNIVIEWGFAQDKPERVAALAADLVNRNVDVIVTYTTPAIKAAMQVTKTIPIVMANVGDPVVAGLVASLARPGGNVTGLSNLSLALNGKRLELLKEVFPKLSRVGVFWNPDAHAPALKELESIAPSLGVELRPVAVRVINDIASAFELASKARANGFITLQTPLFVEQRARIVASALNKRLPAIYPDREIAEAGGLMAYGPDVNDNFRRAAVYIDKILKGTKPEDLPVEQPTKFEFVVNLKTAKQIGLTIPPNVLVRADRVIR
jgi:putative ABC transport system substrate-binding protein